LERLGKERGGALSGRVWSPRVSEYSQGGIYTLQSSSDVSTKNTERASLAEKPKEKCKKSKSGNQSFTAYRFAPTTVDEIGEGGSDQKGNRHEGGHRR